MHAPTCTENTDCIPVFNRDRKNFAVTHVVRIRSKGPVTLRQILRNFHFRRCRSNGGSGTSASAETSISASQIFGERNLRFGVSALAETPTFDILEKIVVVSVLFFLTSVIVVNFGKFWVMRWTIENEELPLSLYFEVKIRRYEKKMKEDVKCCKWIAGKLRDEAKLDYSTTLMAKLNIMKMAEISMALGCRRFNRSLSGWESGWEIHRPDTTWKLAAISDKKTKLE